MFVNRGAQAIVSEIELQEQLPAVIGVIAWAAARHITGTQWSGPKFFGLKPGKGGK